MIKLTNTLPGEVTVEKKQRDQARGNMAHENPYTASSLPCSTGLPVDKKARTNLVACLSLTALVAVVSSIPLAGVVGLLFRFPVPFAEYMSGPSAFVPAMIAAVIYSFVGGIIVQATMGCVGGLIVYRLAHRNSEKINSLILLSGTLSALPGLFLLAMLDWIIGPW